jgi:hypothetical protein
MFDGCASEKDMERRLAGAAVAGKNISANISANAMTCI